MRWILTALSPAHLRRAAMFSDGIEHLVLQREPRSVHEPPPTQCSFPSGHHPPRVFDTDLCEGRPTISDSSTINDRTDDDKTLILASRVTPELDGR